MAFLFGCLELLHLHYSTFQQLGTYSDDFDCFRSDGTDLTEQWLQEKGSNARFVMTSDDLEAVNVEETEYLFGLFGKSHLEYDHDRQEGRDPTLAQMVEKAIGVLKKESNGFVLLVEGGRIDHAHHDVLVFSKRSCLTLGLRATTKLSSS